MPSYITAGIENLNRQNDPGLLPLKITVVIRTEIILKGSIQVNRIDFSQVNDKGRRFSEYHYILANGQKLDRHWIIYSQTKDTVYCFPG